MSREAAPIIVVTGLPRAGTSLVMQLLEAAGVPPLTDGVRAADESNPRGYYELEAVKRVHASTDFLEGAGGRAVKVVAPLLPALPADRSWRVVFVVRALPAVLRSQKAMLERSGASAGEAPDAALERAFAAALERARAWIDGAREARSIEIDHAELLANPGAVAERLLAFLDLDAKDPAAIARMAAVVDPALDRSGAATG